jgi:hypothetical protein
MSRHRQLLVTESYSLDTYTTQRTGYTPNTLKNTLAKLIGCLLLTPLNLKKAGSHSRCRKQGRHETIDTCDYKGLIDNPGAHRLPFVVVLSPDFGRIRQHFCTGNEKDYRNSSLLHFLLQLGNFEFLGRRHCIQASGRNY